METVFQSILPVFTLILGYMLNVWVGSVESRRDIRRRRIAEKEKAYGEISSKLHELFEKKRLNTLKETSTLADVPIWGKPDISVIVQAYDELMAVVFKNNLYLPHHMIQALLDLKIIDLREGLHNLPSEKAERITFLENHADRMWSRAKAIIDKMRKDLELGEYPDEMLKLWR